MDDREDQMVGLGLLTIPSYHRELVTHLRATEPELWAWFSESSAVADRQDDSAEVALLTSAYRLEGGVHDVLVGHATLLAHRFGITDPIVLYQELGSGERNARVFRLNGRINVVFSGDLLDLLDNDEQVAVLAHELAHIALWSADDSAYYVLDHLIHRLASEPIAADAVVETARRLRLHTEIWADAMATEVVDSIPAVVTSIVKVNAGIRHVEADAYLRQAAEILELDARASQAWTHPELHIRVACIEARSRGTSESATSDLVSGPDDLERLDLLGQIRLQELVRRVLRSGADIVGENEGTDSYLASYPEFDLSAVTPVADGELTGHEPSIRWMAAAMLVDLALCDGSSEGLDDLRNLSMEAERQGVADEFDKVLARAMDRTPPQTHRIRRGDR